MESVRERTPMTPFPAPNRLHVWWARRPLVASRAAILASLLPADADRAKFLHMLGIHGDPVAAKRRIAEADGRDERSTRQSAYSYKRAFSYSPDHEEREWLRRQRRAIGLEDRPCWIQQPAVEASHSKPFGSGLRTIANDLNPVAWLILKATVEFPLKYGASSARAVSRNSAANFARRVVERLARLLSRRAMPNASPTPTSGPARSRALTAAAWCRCRPTGGSTARDRGAAGPAHRGPGASALHVRDRRPRPRTTAPAQ